MVHKRKKIVISLGGSIIVPKDVDWKFLLKFRKTIQKLKKKHKIVICTGGGNIARKYIFALKKCGFRAYQQDIIGIEATRLNAKLISVLLGLKQEIPKSLKEVKNLFKKKEVVVCGGLMPGMTSDGSTALIASELGANEFINMTNVFGLYDKDPKKYKDAKLIKKISHEEFKKIVERIGQKPGQHFVMDRKAAEIARKKGIKIVILKGTKNLENYVLGKKFVGTVIF